MTFVRVPYRLSVMFCVGKTSVQIMKDADKVNTVSSLLIQITTSLYRSADKSLARPTSRCSLFDGENISFDVSLVIYINSTNIPPIMIINRIYETQNLLSLSLVSFLVGLRTYQQPCTYILRC